MVLGVSLGLGFFLLQFAGFLPPINLPGGGWEVYFQMQLFRKGLQYCSLYIKSPPPWVGAATLILLRRGWNRPFLTLAFLRHYVLNQNLFCARIANNAPCVSTDSVSVRSGPTSLVNLRPFGEVFLLLYFVAVLRGFLVVPSPLCGENWAFTLFCFFVVLGGSFLEAYHENAWKSMEINENRWESMKIMENS